MTQSLIEEINKIKAREKALRDEASLRLKKLQSNLIKIGLSENQADQALILFAEHIMYPFSKKAND